MAKKVAVIICAAGSSSRFDGKRNKVFVDVEGRAVFLRSVELFSERDDVSQILLAISSQDEELVKIKWGANLQFFNVKICLGGKERFETVSNALKLVDDDTDLIAVHDAARCCATAEWIDKVFQAAEKTSAAMLAAPVTATIKKVDNNVITQTIDRSGLYEAQTPQVFDAKLLKSAYDNIHKLDKSLISDDSQVVEAAGGKVTIVPTDQSNIKITTSADMAIASAIIKSRAKAKPDSPTGPYTEVQW